MSTRSAGQPAPAIKLPATHGGTFSLTETLQSSVPVVTAFFKVSCPTCQYAFPFLERIFKAYPQDKVKILGVSQNSKQETDAFAKQYGVTFPIALDDTRTFPASNAYGLTYVPSIFFIAPEQKIEQASIGWVKEEIEQLNQRVAKSAGVSPAQIFPPGESVLEFKAA